jgi:hypothetical protein
MERCGQIIVTYITTLLSSLGTFVTSSASLILFDITHEALVKALVIFLYVVFQVGTPSVALGSSAILLLPDIIHLLRIDGMIIIVDVIVDGDREGREDSNDA